MCTACDHVLRGDAAKQQRCIIHRSNRDGNGGRIAQAVLIGHRVADRCRAMEVGSRCEGNNGAKNRDSALLCRHRCDDG
ncbi:hypothetical protein D3C80_577100 [compost metagenome]